MIVEWQVRAARYCVLAAVILFVFGACDSPATGPQPSAVGDSNSTSSLQIRTTPSDDSLTVVDAYSASNDRTLTRPATSEFDAQLPVRDEWLQSTSRVSELSGSDRSSGEEPPSGTQSSADAEAFRTWTSRSGQTTVQAKIVAYGGDFVRLERRNGKQFRVDVERLSEADREWIALRRRMYDTALTGVQLSQPVEESQADMSLRNDDYPRTYIQSIHVDLTNPHHWVRLTWTGPQADRQEAGPFHSSPGAGLGRNDCDDVGESQRNGSNCTPKGENVVEGYSDYLPSVPRCKFVTWFNKQRQIAFHSHWHVPRYPASHGCVRLDPHAAQLIHNNSKVAETRVFVDGTWSRW